MNVLSGSYNGDGTTGRVVSGLGFTPLCVIIKARTGSREGQICMSVFGANATKTISNNTSAGLTTGRITSLDSDGFTLGSDATVNATSTVYDWLALGSSSSGDIFAGTYTGTGASNARTGVGFQPDAVIIADGDSATRCEWASSDMPSGHASNFGIAGGITNGTGVTSLDADGFTLSTNNAINASGHSYYFIALKATTNRFKTLTYTGNATDNRSITGAGFRPDNVITKNQGQTIAAAFRGRTVTGDAASKLDTTNNTADFIQALETDGFQVGTNDAGNTTGQTYYAMVFKDAVATSVPLYTPFVVFTREHDIAKDGPTTTYYFEAFLKTSNASFAASARLYNVTDSSAVSGSAVSTASTTATRVRSSAITLASGSKVYRAEFGGDGGSATYTCYGADIIADVSG